MTKKRAIVSYDKLTIDQKKQLLVSFPFQYMLPLGSDNLSLRKPGIPRVCPNWTCVFESYLSINNATTDATNPYKKYTSQPKGIRVISRNPLKLNIIQYLRLFSAFEYSWMSHERATGQNSRMLPSSIIAASVSGLDSLLTQFRLLALL